MSHVCDDVPCGEVLNSRSLFNIFYLIELMLNANRKGRKRSINEVEIIDVDEPQQKRKRNTSQDSDDEDMTTNNGEYIS